MLRANWQSNRLQGGNNRKPGNWLIICSGTELYAGNEQKSFLLHVCHLSPNQNEKKKKKLAQGETDGLKLCAYFLLYDITAWAGMYWLFCSPLVVMKTDLYSVRQVCVGDGCRDGFNYQGGNQSRSLTNPCASRWTYECFSLNINQTQHNKVTLSLCRIGVTEQNKPDQICGGRRAVISRETQFIRPYFADETQDNEMWQPFELHNIDISRNVSRHNAGDTGETEASQGNSRGKAISSDVHTTWVAPV